MLSMTKENCSYFDPAQILFLFFQQWDPQIPLYVLLLPEIQANRPCLGLRAEEKPILPSL